MESAFRWLLETLSTARPSQSRSFVSNFEACSELAVTSLASVGNPVMFASFSEYRL